MRIGLLNNLRAGRNQNKVTKLLQFLKGHPDVVSIETDSALAVPEVLAELAAKDVDLLVVNGGDGTLQHALTEILGHRAFDGRVPLVAPIRGGRTNMSALDLGTGRDVVRSMSELIASVRDGTLEERITPRQVLRVEYGPEKSFQYGMFFGGGMIYKAIELNHRLFKQDSQSQGVLGATLVTAGLIGRACVGDRDGILAPNKVQVMLDGEPLPLGEFNMIISSTLTRLFARMRPFWGTGTGGVRFTAIASGARGLSRKFAGVLRGKPGPAVHRDPNLVSENVKRAEMRFDCGFTVDGELVSPEPGRVVSLTADDTVHFVRA